MRLEPLYTVTFTTPEAWSVEVDADAGNEGRSFLLAEGRSTGRLSARYRAANFPRKRADGALLPEFRGVLETDDGAAVLFEWQGLAVLTDSGPWLSSAPLSCEPRSLLAAALSSERLFDAVQIGRVGRQVELACPARCKSGADDSLTTTHLNSGEHAEHP